MLYVILTLLLRPFLTLACIFCKRPVFEKILVVQTAKIGDMICSTPVFREIKKKYPGAKLSVMANEIVRGLLSENPYVDEVLVFKAEDSRGLSGRLALASLIRRGRYDVAVCLNPNEPFAVALFWGFVPLRVSVMPDQAGLTFRLASTLFNRLEPHRPETLITLTWVHVLRGIGIETDDIQKEVYAARGSEEKAAALLSSAGSRIIGIALSSGNKLKELGVGKMTELVKGLLGKTGSTVVLVGSAGDGRTASEVLSLLGPAERARVIDSSGTLSLAELPALIRRFSVFIGVDTGIIYMADALSVPVVHIAGPLNISEQRPVGLKTVTLQPELECVPCTYIFDTPYACKTGTRECVVKTEMEEVINAAASILGPQSERL